MTQKPILHRNAYIYFELVAAQTFENLQADPLPHTGATHRFLCLSQTHV
jgi:hypothetical protein